MDLNQLPKLNEIPQWMEKYIPMITEGECKTVNDITSCLDVMVGTYGEILTATAVREINGKIDLLTRLKKAHLI